MCLHNAIMEIANRRVLDKAARKHAALRTPIARWLDVVSAASWRNIEDVRATFPSADGVRLHGGTTVTVFNIGGNNYRLIAVVFYESQQVFVADILTHTEYDKQQWKDRL
jgi:mRNA interferase HigB